jgi:Rad3-related DNA helicase
MKQIERIEQMERAMDTVAAAAEGLERALENWEEAQPALEALTAYYEGPLWRKDFEADEAGKLPQDLKRGVLSQDGVWDLLNRVRDLREEMARLAEKEKQ